jgi:hypothetical protein
MEEQQQFGLTCMECTVLNKVRSGEVKLQVGTDVWKWISTTLSGALITLIICWFVWPAKAVTRPDMEEFMKSYSPYALDRQMVVGSLADLKVGQEKLVSEIKVLRENQAQLEILMRSHIQKDE